MERRQRGQRQRPAAHRPLLAPAPTYSNGGPRSDGAGAACCVLYLSRADQAARSREHRPPRGTRLYRWMQKIRRGGQEDRGDPVGCFLAERGFPGALGVGGGLDLGDRPAPDHGYSTPPCVSGALTR